MKNTGSGFKLRFTAGDWLVLYLISAPTLLKSFLVNNSFFIFFRRPLASLYSFLFERSAYWPQDAIRRMQMRRLRIIVDIAARHVPFYRDHFHKYGVDVRAEWDDHIFRRIPVISKVHLRDEVTYVTNEMIPLKACFPDRTSGTTGEPFLHYYDRNFVLRGMAIRKRMWRMAGMQKGDVVVRFTPRQRYGFEAVEEFFPCYRYEDIEKRLNDMNSLYGGRKVILCTLASYALEIARVLSFSSRSFFLRSVVTQSEYLAPEEKEFIQKQIQRPVFSSYATSELGRIAQECSYGNFHVNQEWCYLEIIGENDEPLLNDEEGRVVVTLFDNEVMPFIRYDTKDRGRLVSRKCPCGRTSQVLEFSGREKSFVFLSESRKISHLDLLGPFYSRVQSIKKFQIIQVSLGEIEVKIVPSSNFQEHSLPRLKDELLDVLNRSISVKLSLVEDIPPTRRGKHANFISYIEWDAVK